MKVKNAEPGNVTQVSISQKMVGARIANTTLILAPMDGLVFQILPNVDQIRSKRLMVIATIAPNIQCAIPVEDNAIMLAHQVRLSMRMAHALLQHQVLN